MPAHQSFSHCGSGGNNESHPQVHYCPVRNLCTHIRDSQASHFKNQYSRFTFLALLKLLLLARCDLSANRLLLLKPARFPIGVKFRFLSCYRAPSHQGTDDAARTESASRQINPTRSGSRAPRSCPTKREIELRKRSACSSLRTADRIK